MSKNRKSPAEHASDFKWTEKIGIDNLNWASKPDKNGVFKWYRYDLDKIKDAFDYSIWWFGKDNFKKNVKYDKADFLKKFKKLKKELYKHNIFAYYIPDQGKYGVNTHYLDFLWDDALKKFKIDEKKDFDFKSTIIITDDVYLYSAVKKGELIFQHNIIKKDKDILYKILTDIFTKKNIIPSKSPGKAIVIKLNKL